MPSFLSPGGLIIMGVAIILDLAGFMAFILSFVGIGIPLSFMLDMLGVIFIGGWIFLASGKAKVTKRAFRRFGLGTLGELIPFVGDIFPFWTIIVYSELKGGDEKEKPRKGLIKKALKKIKTNV